MSGTQKFEQEARALLEQQQFGPAQRVLEQWLNQEPDNAQAHYLIAGAYGNTGQFRQAEQHCRQALSLQPGYFEAVFRLANSLDGQGKLKEALEYFEQAISLNAQVPHVWNNMGACLMSQQSYLQAERAYRKAVELLPQAPQFHLNLALALIPQSVQSPGKLEEAKRLIAEVEKNGQGQMDLADQLYFDTLLGISFLTFNVPEYAERYFRKNLEQEPDNAESHLNLSLSLVAQNRENEALDSIKRARESWLKGQPEEILAEIYWTESLIHLGLGDYEKAWPLYEYRWKRDNKSLKSLPKSIWTGEPLEGKTLYLFHEQGFGDNLQFARYFSQLKARGARIIYECQKPLARLFSSISDIDKLIHSGDSPGEYDYYLPLASLPGVLGTTVEAVPFGSQSLQADENGAYLSVPEGDYTAIDEVIASNGKGKRIAVFWRGSGSQANDKRPCDLDCFRPLFEKDGISWFSLQKEYISESDEDLMRQNDVVDLRSLVSDFADTAYVIKQMDLVISIDTSVAHLTGALGCPGFILLPYACDWRWGRKTSRSPWYQSLTLYRQTQARDWSEVIATVSRDLGRDNESL